jgi:hypothetical protein
MSFSPCEILNIYRSGPGVELSRSSDATDGFLDIATVRASERDSLKNVLKKCLSDNDRGLLLPTRKVQSVRLALGRSELNLDDEVIWPPVHLASRHQISVTIGGARGPRLPAAGFLHAGKLHGPGSPRLPPEREPVCPIPMTDCGAKFGPGTSPLSPRENRTLFRHGRTLRTP